MMNENYVPGHFSVVSLEYGTLPYHFTKKREMEEKIGNCNLFNHVSFRETAQRVEIALNRQERAPPSKVWW